MENKENGKQVIIEKSDGVEKHDGESNNAIKTDGTEIEKSAKQIIVELIEYVPNSVLSKTIMKKTTGNVTVVSFDSGEALTEKISPYDTFIQIIEGMAEIIIAKKTNALNCGDGIIIPAHASHIVKANVRFKMLQTVIKSGYE